MPSYYHPFGLPEIYTLFDVFLKVTRSYAFHSTSSVFFADGFRRTAVT